MKIIILQITDYSKKQSKTAKTFQFMEIPKNIEYNDGVSMIFLQYLNTFPLISPIFVTSLKHYISVVKYE